MGWYCKARQKSKLCFAAQGCQAFFSSGLCHCAKWIHKSEVNGTLKPLWHWLFRTRARYLPVEWPMEAIGRKRPTAARCTCKKTPWGDGLNGIYLMCAWKGNSSLQPMSPKGCCPLSVRCWRQQQFQTVSWSHRSYLENQYVLPACLFTSPLKLCSGMMFNNALATHHFFTW